MCSLVAIVINDGLRDISTDKNKYGVARNIVQNIIAFDREFACIYDDVAFGRFKNSRGCKYDCDGHPMAIWPFIAAAAYGGHIHIMEYYISMEPEYDIRDVIERAARGGHAKVIRYLIKSPLYPKNIYVTYDAIQECYWCENFHLIEVFIEENVITTEDIITCAARRENDDLINYIKNDKLRAEIRANKNPKIRSYYIAFTGMDFASFK